MNRKPLIQTNPYLKGSANRLRLLSIAISSSTAIEGIYRVLPEPISFGATAAKSVILRGPVVSYGSRR